MHALKVGEWINRYPGTCDDMLRTIEKVNADVIHTTLPDAMASVGIGARECICVRELRLPVAVNTSSSIRSQSRAWSRAFVAQFHRILRNGDGVVRYRTRTQAQLSCAENILRGDLTELWAWCRMGLLKVGENASDVEVLDAWCLAARHRGPDQIAVWRHLLTSPDLVLAGLRLSGIQWRLHLQAMGALLGTNLIEFMPAPGDKDQFTARHEATAALEPAAIAESAFTLSNEPLPVLLQTPAFRSALIQSGYAAREALILIAIAVTEPGLFHTGSAASKWRIQRMQRRLRRAATPDQGDSHRPGEAEVDAVDVSPALERDHETAMSAEPDFAVQTTVVPGELSIERTDEPTSDPEIQTGSELMITRHGGLFYLFNVILEYPEFIPELLDNSVFQSRPSRWAWYWLGRFLIGANDAHTAALVFSGADSDDDAQIFSNPRPDEKQTEALSVFSEGLLDRFQQMLVEAGGEPIPEIRAHLCVNAVIALDTSWTEVTYSLEGVDIAVRRAGLDRDPNFLPWLGRVVRFVYA